MTNLRHSLFLLALIALAVPLFADSPEVQVGAVVAAPAPYSRGDAAAASDGTDFFVVWVDHRTPGRGAIVGTRVTRGGEVLDPFGIRIASAPAAMGQPLAVWDGVAYVVVWSQGMHFGEMLERHEVWTTRVDRDGHVLAAPRLIAQEMQTTQGVYAASNGSVTVIAYRNVRAWGTVTLAVLDREGNVTHRQFLGIDSPSFGHGVSIAATASHFLVTWGTGQSKVFAIALDSRGRSVGSPALIGEGEDPVIATDGTSFAIAWRHWLPDVARWEVMSRTAGAQLTQLGAIQTLASDQSVESLSLLWRDDRYEVIAGHQSQTETRINPYGLMSIEFDREGNKNVASRRGDPLQSYTVPQPVAATNGSDVLVAYKDPDSYTSRLVARLYRGSSPDPDVQKLLSWSGNAHERPAIASSASGHIAAWRENQSVYATRIDANGNSLDGRGVRISSVGFAVRVAFDGTNYVVAWLDNGFIGVVHIAPATGRILAQVNVPVKAWIWENFALAVSPEAAYLAWVGEGDFRVRMARVAPGSSTPDFPSIVSPEGMVTGHPALAWNGSMLLVAWDQLDGPRGNLLVNHARSVQAARVSSSLALLDPAPLIVAKGGAFWLGAPSVASNGEDWLVVTHLDERHLVARRVLRNGNLEGTDASILGEGIAPAVTWDGKRYAVAHKTATIPNLPQSPLLLGTVAARGALLPLQSKVIATDVVSAPALARTPSDDVAVIYTKAWPDVDQLGVERSYFRVIDLDERRRAVGR
ncbi:MAG TPA: hypothetical protein VF618_21590 [Thermoanaerobaculia bacterium]